MDKKQSAKPFRRENSGRRVSVAPSLSQDSVVKAFLWHKASYYSPVAYRMDRNFEYILSKDGYDFDLRGFLHDLIRSRGQADILNSGAGFFELDADIKKTFGNKAFLTSVNVVNGKLPESDVALTKLMEKSYRWTMTNHPPRISLAPDYAAHRNQLRQAEKNAKMPDEIKVTRIENFHPTRKYDVIIDLFGGLYYSINPRKVMELYGRALKPYGVCIVPNFGAHHSSIRRLNTADITSAVGLFAKSHGFYFEDKFLGRGAEADLHGLTKKPLT